MSPTHHHPSSTYTPFNYTLVIIMRMMMMMMVMMMVRMVMMMKRMIILICMTARMSWDIRTLQHVSN